MGKDIRAKRSGSKRGSKRFISGVNGRSSGNASSRVGFLSTKQIPMNRVESIVISGNFEKGVYALLMMNKEIQENLFFTIISKNLRRKEITKAQRKEIWVNLSKFYLKRNPPDLAILTYQGHRSLIPINSLMIGKGRNANSDIWDGISNKNHVYLSKSKNCEDEVQRVNSQKNAAFDTPVETQNRVSSQIEMENASAKTEEGDTRSECNANETAEAVPKEDESKSEEPVPKDSESARFGKEPEPGESKQTETKDSLKYKYLVDESNLKRDSEVASQKEGKSGNLSMSIENEIKDMSSCDSGKSSTLKRKLTNVNKGNIDFQMIEQIRIDVIRTKQWKNSDYHELLKSLIIKFIIRYQSKLEYFQGFNYITSFLLDVFGNQEEALLILDYVKDILLEDFFFDNLCPKLSLLHFQINHVIRHHYPLLHTKWKNNEILSEVLFSSFIISLFTSFVIEDQDFIQEFWDIILIERWEGLIKILMYLIEVFYDDIIRMDGNDTMKFFSEMKSEPYILKKVKKYSVKDFVNNLNFNSEFLKESKRLFLSIERKNIV